MPRPYIAMRKIREVIRLTLAEGMSLRQVSASPGVPPTTLAEHVRRIRDAGLTWPLPADLDDDALEAMLFAQPGPRAGPPGAGLGRGPPGAAAQGRDLDAALARVQQTFPDGYAYGQFNELSLIKRDSTHADKQNNQIGWPSRDGFAGASLDWAPSDFAERRASLPFPLVSGV